MIGGQIVSEIKRWKISLKETVGVNLMKRDTKGEKGINHKTLQTNGISKIAESKDQIVVCGGDK
jgi:hypothetical protein